ncbi:hypothetical protein [Sphingomonas sp. BK481]|jgi:hypothetical protein|uniref:hypothetical protein n=1 Tax=Sphingomonas sp. BK481 TaxID=2586981 RepID=UPI00160EAABD|nr:hypothetical protein [Sphingomonas sp. BK481]MBB3589474.1 hypothetical protein [Sphingomonas sp. BK481]
MHLIERAFGQIYDLQRRLEIAGGETAFRFRNDARDAAANDTPSIFPGPRSQVDDPVRLCDGAHVMFDDYDGRRQWSVPLSTCNDRTSALVTASRRVAHLPERASSWPGSGHDDGRVVDPSASRRFGSAGQ